MISKGITDCNFEPLVIKHTCPEERIGKEMTLAEKDKFVKEFLFEAYKNRGSNVQFHQEGNIDLSLNDCIRKNLIVRFADENGNHSSYDANTAMDAYYSGRAYPVLVLVSLLDMSIFQKTGAPGALLCGDEFCAKMSCISLIPEEREPECNKTDEELIESLSTAWKNLDSSIFKEILHPRFNYSSSNILDIISCKSEYLEYIIGKFDTIKSGESAPEVEVGLMHGQKVVVLSQSGNPPAALRFVSEGGKIFDMEMTNYVEDTAPLSKYELEFRWVPSLVDAFNKGDIPQQALSDIRWWKESLEKMGSNRFDFSFDEIKTQNITFEDGITALLYIFPDADKAPLAKYGIVVFEKNKNCVYVTIERDDYTPGAWFLCTQSKGSHGNMGEIPNCNSPEEFKAIVEKKLGHTKRKGILSVLSRILS